VNTSASFTFCPQRSLQPEDREHQDLRRHRDDEPDADVRHRLDQ
jgi:hypothetical protein